MTEKLRPIAEVRANLDEARREFSQNALSEPTPESLEKGWDAYTRIAELEDEEDRVDSANSPRLHRPRPTLPDLVELRKRLYGEVHDISAAKQAEFVFSLRIKGSRIGLGQQSMLTGLGYLERIKAVEFCLDMLAPRR